MESQEIPSFLESVNLENIALELSAKGFSVHIMLPPSNYI